MATHAVVDLSEGEAIFATVLDNICAFHAQPGAREALAAFVVAARFSPKPDPVVILARARAMAEILGRAGIRVRDHTRSRCFALAGSGPRATPPGMRQDAAVTSNAAQIVTTANGLTIVGELDIDSAGQLEASLLEHVGETLYVNCEGVTFVDSSALSALIRASADGVDLRLTHVPNGLRRLLTITGLTEFIAE